MMWCGLVSHVTSDWTDAGTTPTPVPYRRQTPKLNLVAPFYFLLTASEDAATFISVNEKHFLCISEVMVYVI